jgi:transposase InsO family protein
MNIHKNARLTLVRRLEMVRDIVEGSLAISEAADCYAVTAPTVRKWLGRYLASGEAGLGDRSSRPTVSPRSIDPKTALTVIELRRKRLTQVRIANYLGLSRSTVGRVLRRAGLSHLRDLDPVPAVVRYEHAEPGDLLHLDTKKLGRIERMSHRITGNRRDTTEGAGWEFLFVAIDDHARIAFTEMYPTETRESAVRFLERTVAYFQSIGVRVKAVLTDNCGVFRSRDFAAACQRFGIRQRFTRPYRPQTNGKAERFIQSALREWAYGVAYHHSSERTAKLHHWVHHYNWHRPHQGIGGLPPTSRLARFGNNLLKLHN